MVKEIENYHENVLGNGFREIATKWNNKRIELDKKWEKALEELRKHQERDEELTDDFDNKYKEIKRLNSNIEQTELKIEQTKQERNKIKKEEEDIASKMAKV